MIIKYPGQLNEAEIQAFLHMDLLALSIDSRMEVKYQTQEAKYKPRVQFARFDIVIFKDKVAQCIVEVKGPKRNGKIRATGLQKQLRKYGKFNLPIFTCLGKTEIKKTVIEVQELLN